MNISTATNILNGDYSVNYVLQVHLGDAIWSQTLIKELSNGKPIIWGTEWQFVEGLQRAYPDVFWIDVNALNKEYQQFMLDCIIGGCRVIPIGHSSTIMKVPYKQVMRAKYDCYGYDWNIWRQTMYQRDMDREMKLASLLNLPKEYNLINTRFRSNESGIVPVEVNNGLPNIVMDSYQGFSLFDWSWIIENATTIHTVSTSILFIMELLTLKAREIHLYARRPDEKNFENVEYLFTKPYICHT